MAFFTFTTVSGSAATNNLVYTVTPTVGTVATLSLSSTGTLVYTNVQGNSTDTGWTLANLAIGGQPVTTTVAAPNNVIGVTLTTFQTPGLVAKAAGAFTSVDATDATSAQVDAFIANSNGAAAQSLNHASVSASQFAALAQRTLLANGGVTSLDATDATAGQMATIVTQRGLIGTGAIENASVLYADFATITPAKFAVDGAAIDASQVAAGTGAGQTNEMIALVNANITKVASVQNVSVNATTDIDGSAFATFAAVLEPQGVISVGAADFSTAEWASLVTNRALFAPGVITGANTVTLATFAAIPNKFAVGGVASGLSFATATADQIATVVANQSKVADSAITNATLTPAQFAGLTVKIGNNQATVNAATATAAEDNAIVANLGKFGALKLTNLSIDQNQFATAMGNAAALNTAVDNGQVTVNATSAAIVQVAAGFTKTLVVNGSDGADYITSAASGAMTVQGAKGADSIVGSSSADVLAGGNAADTIVGGDGNDTITGGNSILANVLTGGANNDTFNANGGVNTITDLGGANGGDVDVLVNSALVSATVTTTANDVVAWAATSASSNSGALTVNMKADAGAAARSLDLMAMLGTAGVTVVGNTGTDTIDGTRLNDKISGGDGNDDLSGWLGSNTLTGGAGNDTFDIVATAIDTITDLSGSDVLKVAANGAVTATVSANWTATTTTDNDGLATLNVANGVTVVNVAASSNPGVGTGNGYSISAAGNAIGAALTGSAFADTIIGSNAADTIAAGAGADKIEAGSGTDRVIGDSNAEVQTLTFTTTLAANTATVVVGGVTLAGIVQSDTEATSAANVATAINASAALQALGITATVTGAGLDVVTISSVQQNGNIAQATYTSSGAGVTVTAATTTQGALNIAADTMAGGDGNDTFFISAGDALNTVANADVITGLNLDGDIINLFNGTAGNATVVTIGSAVQTAVNAAASLGAAVDIVLAAAAGIDAAREVGTFTYGGDTYLLANGDGNTSYHQAADNLIKITGASGSLSSGDVVFIN